ncbi:Oidioi.mRNA.OKI2018_I69.chr1.g370.t1.cds [Oikopleura dioica]|uniref:Oidioi.mRNA.OKI2018_I69.chr1.g370.t1.cds n=1 Tax=Oikopleura dioica TaxID=34765 RepID=A0ABN7SRT9_OIKDI|nr:Oidioi.mRNA.OKI2018_I69.chr1.g370.t1.cds [Oikopleura dioica]
MDALQIIRNHADQLRRIDTSQFIPAMARLSQGRNYDFSRIEYDVTTPHMRRARRFPGQRARFVHFHNFTRAFGHGITEEMLQNGSFYTISTFKDFETGLTRREQIKVRVPMGSRHNSINFCDIFYTFCKAVDEVASELGERWAECGADAGDMCVHAKRHMLNHCLQHLTMATTEVLTLLDLTGHYIHEIDCMQEGAWSTYGFDQPKMQYLFVYRFAQKLVDQRAPCQEANALIVPRHLMVQDCTCLNQLLNALRIFGDTERLVRFEDRVEAGRDYVAVQFLHGIRNWPDQNLDLLKFFGMYIFLTAEAHAFLGNDEIACSIGLTICWMARSADDERLLMKYGFYGLFVDMIRRAKVIYGDFRRVEVEHTGEFIDAAPIDAFHPNFRNINLVPKGMGRLWVGTETMRIYPGRLPANGSLAIVPINNEREGNAYRRLYPDDLARMRLNYREGRDADIRGLREHY